MKNLESTEKILFDFKKLSTPTQYELLQSLRVEFEGKVKLHEVAKSELTTKKPCAHCQSSHVNKRGKQNGVQMYTCITCK